MSFAYSLGPLLGDSVRVRDFWVSSCVIVTVPEQLSICVKCAQLNGKCYANRPSHTHKRTHRDTLT